MDSTQNRQVADQIRDARIRKGWTQEHLAEVASVAPNTVVRAEKGETVQATTVGKLFQALEIEPVAEATAREGLPADVHAIMEVITMILTDMPQGERPAAVRKALRALMSKDG